MHLAPLIRDLAIILGVAGLTTYVFRKIKQPVVLGYIVAGFIVGPYTPPFPLITDLPNIRVLGEIGIIFVMLSLGLDFSFHKLVRVGRFAMGTAVLEVAFMGLLGAATGYFLGWDRYDCIFLGAILSIGSTTIIFKAFNELGLRTRRFAEQVFGVLIVEDLLAILLLAGLSAVVTSQVVQSWSLFFSALRLVVVVGSWFLIGYFFIPTVLRRAGHAMDNETMTVVVTGLCLLMVVAATGLGYSAALGAFITGSILSETRESTRIEHLIQPLRDLFAAVFFVSVGILVNPVTLVANWPTILVLVGVLIVGKVSAVTASSLLMGNSLKSSIQMGLSLAQIGEFSFILAGLGTATGVTSDFLYPMAVAVCVITAFTTPYLIRVSDPLASWVDRSLPTRTHEALSRYARWMQAPSTTMEEDRIFRAGLFRFLLNGILVTVSFVAAARLGYPLLETLTPEPNHAVLLTWGIAILCAAPFVWGMFFAFRDRGLRAFIGHLITIMWVGILSAAFFATTISFIVTLCAGLFFFFLSYRRLEVSYRWFERHLIENIKRDSTNKEQLLESLVPWDLHLVRIHVHPNSTLMGKTLREAAIRQNFGLNVVAIQRGERSLLAPGASETLHPMDQILVLGTDAELEQFRRAAEFPEALVKPGSTLAEYRLERLLIDDKSPHYGKTIRDSGIREKLGGLIVGLENGTLRTTNPDPNRVLGRGDVLWVVTEPHAA